ncbi:hypothetical protein F4825DRAFT_442437 [Nemania diffusa]|nr:hypothetical protein F4825DRAFT_442437 [Nemania diffusa]
MSLDSRGHSHIQYMTSVEPVSPLESSDTTPIQDPLHESIRASGHENNLAPVTSLDSFITPRNSQNYSESDALPTSLVRRLPNHYYVSSDHPRNDNLQRPLPTVPGNLDISYPTSDSCEPIIPSVSHDIKLSPRSHIFTSWWWWWEIFAIILSITSMILIALLLSRINGIPLESWGLPIAPHSLIAILTTVGKTALLVPAASCISQLKWRHFIRRPRKLIDLQHFDDASRGPWGSTLFVWHLAFRARLLVALGFSLVTVLSLGIDPSAQQILGFPVRESPLNNASVMLGTANLYYSKGFLENTGTSRGTWQPNSDLLAIQSSIVNGATGSVFQPYFNCPAPASRCVWDTFTTFGMCTKFWNASGEAVPHCSPLDPAGTMNCTYSLPGIDVVDDEDNTMVMQWNSESTGGAGPSTMVFQSQFSSSGIDASRTHIGSLLAVKALGNGYPTIETNATGVSGLSPPPTEVYYATFDWCAKKFQGVSASQKHIDPSPITSEGLTFVDTVELGDQGNLMGTNYYTYEANVTHSNFSVSTMALDYLPKYLGTLLTTTVYHNIYRPDNGPTDDLLAVGFALMNSNLSHVVSDIAETLTNQIRSNDPGDNYNATTTAGKAFFDEPYIEVQWAYLVLPLIVTLLTAVLLVVTIIVTDKQPLLKHSSMALLVNRLHGWADEELDVNGPQTQEKLDELAEVMVAGLEDDENGRMRLVRKKLE